LKDHARLALAALAETLLIRDLHRLLWIPGLVNRGEPDGGWSCRDHAAILGALLALHQVPADLAHGRCMFVQGATSGRSPSGIGQELGQASGHTWLEIAGAGIVDLSPNLAPDPPQRGWYNLDFAGIVFDRWRPAGAGQVIRCSTAAEYSRQIALASHLEDGVVALYLEERRSAFDPLLLVTRTMIDSPQCDRVFDKYGPSAYVSVVLHLRDLLLGEAPPVGGVSQSKAWSTVLSRYPDPLAEWRRSYAARHDPG
jgi:hypothetical protein